jgi:D-glycerate 3-kinase
MTPAEQQFLTRNRLHETYLRSAEKWFSPLLEKIQPGRDKALIIGINGSQGSGKSTLADYLCTMLKERHALRSVSLSLDDFYLTQRERQELAKRIHPLLETRGVPGTHDIPLAMQTIAQLVDGSGETVIPRFDKSQDDRMPAAQCDTVNGPVDIIILEGWCVGAKPQTEEQLIEPLNSLEADRDPDGVWRNAANQALAGEYQTLFALLDLLIMLQAPSFETVFNWRLEQEEKMLARLGDAASKGQHQGIMSGNQVAQFIAHYQRITEQSLAEMPERADHLYKLDPQRQIVDCVHR